MKDIKERLIHMHSCRGFTRRRLSLFLAYDPTLQSLYKFSSSKLSQLFHIPQKSATLFYTDLHDATLLHMIKQYQKHYSIITFFDDIYPEILKNIKDPPLVLYAKGDLSLLTHQPVLSVIGTRKPSNEAVGKIRTVVSPLVKHDWLIISGMAKGIDSYAHQLTLSLGGKTIAVLGAGFNHIYPKQNTKLFHDIAKKGLILTEYAPHVPPQRYHFPERNRIISGLSFGTLVIEAMARSGTMITVGQALDQGREVYAIPGSPLIPQTKGCHQMIQDGAKLVYEADDIYEDWQTIGQNLFHF